MVRHIGRHGDGAFIAELNAPPVSGLNLARIEIFARLAELQERVCTDPRHRFPIIAMPNNPPSFWLPDQWEIYALAEDSYDMWHVGRRIRTGLTLEDVTQHITELLR